VFIADSGNEPLAAVSGLAGLKAGGRTPSATG
jgi:hypothetical protein